MKNSRSAQNLPRRCRSGYQSDIFPRYLEDLRDRYLDNGLLLTEKFHTCRHKGCTFRGICVQDDREYTVCDACRRKTCKRCDTYWLPGHFCDEQQPTAGPETEDAATQRYLKERCFPCPGCGRLTEKFGGCDQL